MSRGTQQFLRKVIVDIVPTTGTGVSINGSGANQADLRVNFKCVKTNEGTPNSAVIDLYNLSEATRNLMAARNTVIKLTVGYLGLTEQGQPNQLISGNPGLGIVFIGNAVKVKHVKKKTGLQNTSPIKTKLENTDLVTTVDVGDGDNQYRNAYLDKGYPANTQLQTVLNDLAASMGLNLGPIVDIPSYAYQQGFAVTGLSRDQLDQITNNFDLEWSIQNQSVQIISKTGTAKVSTIVVNSQTGLIRVPNPTNFGVEFTTLCDHRLLPGRPVEITSKYLSGGTPQSYKIRKVTHRGSNWDGDFVSEVQATVPVVFS